MTRFVSGSCQGERCWCGAPAEHKVAEVVQHDDPRMAPQAITPYPGARPFVVRGNFHELTTYVCHAHFRQMMGPAAGD